jgi:CTP-dependent riboflavin kinase
MERFTAMTLNGTLRLSDETGRRTVGKFNELIIDNRETFRRHFHVDLFAGSLNIDVPYPPSLQGDLDAGRPRPTIVIRRNELIHMPDYIGDGQAWGCDLKCAKFPTTIGCWIFRRIGSRVPPGVIEIVACSPLVEPFKLKNGDQVMIDVF